MAEERATNLQPSMNILAQFIKDISFENILSQKGLVGEVNPNIQVQVSLDAKKRAIENQFEVVVRLKIDSKSNDTSDQLFLLELEYAGIFQISNVQESQLHPLLLIECPRMLFPFLRRIVSDITRDGGFPSLNLENIDFVKLYKNGLSKKQASNKNNIEEQDRLMQPLN